MKKIRYDFVLLFTPGIIYFLMILLNYEGLCDSFLTYTITLILTSFIFSLVGMGIQLLLDIKRSEKEWEEIKKNLEKKLEMIE